MCKVQNKAREYKVSRLDSELSTQSTQVCGLGLGYKALEKE